MMKYSQYSIEELKKEIPVFGKDYEDVIEYPEYVSLSIKELREKLPKMFEEPMGEIDKSFYEMVVAELGLFDNIIGHKETYQYCDVTIISGDSLVKYFDYNYVYLFNILDADIISTTSLPEHLQ